MALNTKYGTILGHKLVKSTKKEESHCTYCGLTFKKDQVDEMFNENSWSRKTLTCKTLKT